MKNDVIISLCLITGNPLELQINFQRKVLKCYSALVEFYFKSLLFV